MPAGRFYRATGKSKKKARKGWTLSRSVRTPMPTKLRTKLKYCEQNTLNPGAGGTQANMTFSANGLYDPNITGSGHQPRGFDQIMEMYDHYVCVASSIKVWFANNDTYNPQLVSIVLQDNTTTSTDVINNLESGYRVYTALGSIGNGAAVKKLKYGCNLGKFLGRKNVLSDPELKGSTAANPTEGAYYVVSVAPLVSGVDSDYVALCAEIIYDVYFIEPKNPTSS